MTEGTAKKRKSGVGRGESLSKGELLFCVMSVISLVLSFLFADTAIKAMENGMRLCVGVVIPSLFFFSVLSDMLVSSGGASLLARPLRAVCKKLFGIGGRASEAILLGAICGFPIGTRCALSLYSRGELSRSETEHLLCFCNGPSTAFLINAVGISLFSSRRFGLLLCAAQMLSAVAVGVCMRVYFRNGNSVEMPDFVPPVSEARPKRRMTERAVRAVTDAAESMLVICSFVIFFSALTGVVRALLEKAGLGERASVLLLGIFEMTGGVSGAALLPLPLSAVFVAALVGWSGFSVHFQMIALCKDKELSFAPYFFAKLLGSVFCAFFVALGLYIFRDFLALSPPSASSFALSPEIYPQHLLSIAVLAIGALRMKKRD